MAAKATCTFGLHLFIVIIISFVRYGHAQAPGSPTIENWPGSTLIFGAPFSITCKANPFGGTVLSFDIIKDGAKIQNGITGTQGETYSVAYVTVANAGTYICKAVNGAGTAESVHHILQVNGAHCAAKRANIGYNDATRYITTRDNTTTLTCQLPYYDYPDSYIRWKKNGVELIEGVRTIQTSSGNYTAKRGDYHAHYILEITGPTVHAGGQYDCECKAIYDGSTGNPNPFWDYVNNQAFKVFVSDPLLKNSVNSLMVNGKRRKVGETLVFYPGDSVSISTSVSALTYPGPNRRLTWFWKDTWLAEMSEVLNDQSPTWSNSYSKTNYSFQFSVAVSIVSTCREYNTGDHKLQLADEGSAFNLPWTNFNILTISCKEAPSIFSPTDITALTGGVVHIIAIVLIVVNARKHKELIKGKPFTGLVLLIISMELIIVFSLIFVPTLQSVGQLGKADITLRSYVAAILMAIAGVIVAGVTIGLESHYLNTIHPEDTPGADS